MAQYSNVSPESLDPEQCDFSNIDYDQVNEKVIRDFGEKCIKPLIYIKYIFLRIRRRLKILKGKTLAEVRKQGEYLLYYFLSGVNENGEYEKGSLAKYVKEAWGIYVNTKMFMNFSKYDDPYSYVEVIVSNYNKPLTEDIFKNALHQLRISLKMPSKEDIDKIMMNPDTFLDYLYKFWEFSVRILPPYNVVSSLIYTTRHIPKMLFEQLYGNIAKNNSLMKYLGYCEYKFPKLGNLADKYSFYFQRKDGATNIANTLFTIIKRNMLSYNIHNPEFKNMMEHLPELTNAAISGLKSYFSPLLRIKSFDRITRYYHPSHGNVYVDDYKISIDLNTLNVKLSTARGSIDFGQIRDAFLNPDFNTFLLYLGGRSVDLFENDKEFGIDIRTDAKWWYSLRDFK